MSGVTDAYANFKMSFQISPIILTGGIAAAQGGALPIVSLTDPGTDGTNIASDVSPALDGFFANYYPVPGSSLIRNQIATYPFANQSIAANAIIAQGLNVSMLMVCPARSYPQKLSTMIALQNSLSQHNNSGGTYTVCTPSYIYTYCIMVDMRDVSGGESKQAQHTWQIDFYQPLVSLQAATQALNGLMQKLSDGTVISGTPSWNTTGLPVGNPTSLLNSSLVPQTQLGSAP